MNTRVGHSIGNEGRIPWGLGNPYVHPSTLAMIHVVNAGLASYYIMNIDGRNTNDASNGQEEIGL